MVRRLPRRFRPVSRWKFALPLILLVLAIALAGLRLSAPAGPLHGTGPRLVAGPLERRSADLVAPEYWLYPKREAVEEGWLEVPARRNGEDSAVRLRVHYARLPALDGEGRPRATADDQAAIVYLAHSDAGSSTRSLVGPRHAGLQRLRQLGELIAFDPRSSADAEPAPTCPGDWRGADIQALSALGEQCLAALRAQPGPPRHTAAEAAADLEALRQALGLERVRLLAFGDASALALAYLAAHPQRVERALLVAPADPLAAHADPAQVDQALQRILLALGARPELRARLPEPRESLRTSIARLDQQPQTLRIGGIDVPVDGEALQLALAGALGDRQALAGLGPVLASLYGGDHEPLRPLLQSVLSVQAPRIGQLAAQCQRRDNERRDRRQRLRSPFTLLGDVAGERQRALCAAWPDPLRGAAALPTQPAPLLLVAGELDARAPLEQVRALSRALPGSRLLEVGGGGHGNELLFGSEALEQALHDFLAGRDDALPERIELGPLPPAP